MTISLQTNNRFVKTYYQSLTEFAHHRADHEGATSTAFQTLLQELARTTGWTLIPQRRIRVASSKKMIAPDGTLLDTNGLVRGYWEAKDTKDDLAAEIRNKIKAGYPLNNTIFEDTRSAVLFQNGKEVFRADITQAQALVDLLTEFFKYTEPDIERFEQAVVAFGERVPDLAQGLVDKVQDAHRTNTAFQKAFATFYALTKKSLNPNLSVAAVDEMLVQHLLTVRLITTVFDNPYFLQRNVIAREVEKVIAALTSRAFDPRQFLAELDRFYLSIEAAGRSLNDWSEKQEFLNKIYERFFQGYSVKVADTHGIVYTPQPIVDFMCASVVEVLQQEFGKQLGDPDVVILDPATGTGNFVINLLRRLPQRDLEETYKHRLFANEVMLMPYYIASLNIEHEYNVLSGRYEPFEGICFVDTLDLTERQQLTFDFMTEVNTERVERQRAAPITVIIGNPPYNVGQLNENDNNKNRRYDDHEKAVDRRVRETYAKASKATNKNALSDVYVKFFRWATDRLGDNDGVICYVSNNSFVDNISFDGMRKYLLEDFSKIYVVDLQGNIRRDSMRDGISLGEQHTVFGLAAMVGISIAILVRNKSHRQPTLHYYSVDIRSTRKQKFSILEDAKSILGLPLQSMLPDSKNTWLISENADEYAKFASIGNKGTKESKKGAENAIFDFYSRGLETTRDDWVYDFQRKFLENKVEGFINTYNSEVDRWRRLDKPKDIDAFVLYDDTKIKWSSRLKETLKRQLYATFNYSGFRNALYRPFTKKLVYFDGILNHRQGLQSYFFPQPSVELENRLIWLKVGTEIPVFALVANTIVDLLPQGGSQCFPYYVYDEDGTNRRENITDWALATFRTHYGNEGIGKWDIFYYVYALLHHPTYRTRYADDLKRELPRIPMVTGATTFTNLATWGKELADLHLNYEQATPYRLKWEETAKPLLYRVEKMRLSKDKQSLVVNETLTLHGIPAAVYDYKLGNRSALDWVIDQYRVTTDARSGIVSDPNRADEPRYIVNLVEKIVTVSLRTNELVAQIAQAEWDTLTA